METLISKIGMEIETSRRRFDRCSYDEIPVKSFILKNYMWVGFTNENPTIIEFHVSPVLFKNIKNTVRRFLILTDWFAPDFKYYPGYYDNKAESNHLHISFKHDIKNNIAFLNSLLFLTPFMSRRNEDFREVIDERASICKIGGVSYDSKELWITLKDSNYVEIRLNENPFPGFIFIVEYLLFKALSVSNRKFLDGIVSLLSLTNVKSIEKFMEDNKDAFRLFSYFVFESEYNIYKYYADLYKTDAITNMDLVMLILKEHEKYFKAPFTDFNKYLFKKVKKRFINDKRFKEYKNSDIVEAG